MVRLLQKHQPIGTDTIATVAQSGNLFRRKDDGTIAVVRYQEIVSCSLVFIEFHPQFVIYYQSITSLKCVPPKGSTQNP